MSHATVPGTDRVTGRARGWAGFLAIGFTAAAVYALTTAAWLSALSFSVIGVGAGLSIVYGVHRYRPSPRHPWWFLAAACFFFTTGALLRGWAQETGAASVIADCFTIPGYALMFIGLNGFLRSRTGVKRHAVIDGLIVGLGATLVFAILFAVPAASVVGRDGVVSALAGLYPLLDGVLVLLVLNLAFATARRGPSYYMLISCMSLMLVGDIAYAIIGTAGRLTGSPLLDLPFLLGFTLVGGAGLHPTMVDIGRDESLPVQAWSLRRLVLILPALVVPFVLAVAIGHPSTLERVLLAVGGAALVGLVLARAVSAVRGYAAAQEQYEYQATHDPLTGLPNRARWFAEVRTLLAQAGPDEQVWVFFLDLDGFKYVNDSRGHRAGDQVITEVAARLRQCAPASAAIARVGGDEFVVAYGAARHDAVRLADDILRTIRKTLKMPTVDVVISASIGIAHSTGPEHDVTAEDLLRDADTAMYQAKANGRDNWAMFDPVMRDRVQERIEIDLALREAMAAGCLHLEFQPVVELAGGRIVGAEALIRWTHPTRGVIGPDSFIPVAEESGLIIELGRWVMHEAMRQLAQWRAAGTVGEDFWMSINVSPRQLRDPRLAGELSAALRRHRLPAASVVVELTESVMIDPTSGADQALRSLRDLGLSLVVDDFGTGFSALGYLRTYPVTGVKIDKSFVVGLGHNPEDEAIVRAVVAMSSALQLSVVAEGVEDEHQRDLLARVGVRHGQGWLWGRAVDAETFAALWSPGAVQIAA
ncbi:putative bifunctional diguanylate cyclase/phosphodiesterase [Hamadaea tsunoensis]|uniref:putative bifunctional diguanylate cyclase/phosphodiesterase n=1 Tax=Hamadaea tsunoensis TaxID=53368 RepID=UPI0003FB81A9|nr:EAL domain-containing protein [Hamadaea tsunoensis]